MDLAQAREQFEQASLNLRTQASPERDEKTQALWRSYLDAEQQLLTWERLTAEGEGQPYAAEWKVEVQWPRMSESSVLISGPLAAVLTFKGSTGTHLVVFPGHEAARFSRTNDEVISGHPLYGKGLDADGSFKVMNSGWIEELRSCHSVHSRHDPAYWKSVRHYLISQKEGICEVVTSREPVWHSLMAEEEVLSTALKLCGIEVTGT